MHESRDGKGHTLSVGIMSLRPDTGIYASFVAFLGEASTLFRTAVRSVDQELQHLFFRRGFQWRGRPRWAPGDGRFLDCVEELPGPVHPGIGLQGLGATGTAIFNRLASEALLGTVCALPLRYDFTVSYPA